MNTNNNKDPLAQMMEGLNLDNVPDLTQLIGGQDDTFSLDTVVQEEKKTTSSVLLGDKGFTLVNNVEEEDKAILATEEADDFTEEPVIEKKEEPKTELDVNNLQFIRTAVVNELPQTLSFQNLKEGMSFQALVYCKKVNYRISTNKSPYLMLHLVDGQGYNFKAFLFDVEVDEATAMTLTDKVIEVEGICTLYQNVKSIRLYNIDTNPKTDLTPKDFVVRLDNKKSFAVTVLQTLEGIETKGIKSLCEGMLVAEAYLEKFANAPFTDTAGFLEGGLLKGLHSMLRSANTLTEDLDLNKDIVAGGILLVGLVLFKAHSITSKRVIDILDNELSLPHMEAYYELKNKSLTTSLTVQDRRHLEYIMQSFDFRNNPNPPKTQESLLIYNTFKTVYEQLLYSDRIVAMGGDYVLQEGKYKIVKVD